MSNSSPGRTIFYYFFFFIKLKFSSSAKNTWTEFSSDVEIDQKIKILSVFRWWKAFWGFGCLAAVISDQICGLAFVYLFYINILFIFDFALTLLELKGRIGQLAVQLNTEDWWESCQSCCPEWLRNCDRCLDFQRAVCFCRFYLFSLCVAIH